MACIQTCNAPGALGQQQSHDDAKRCQGAIGRNQNCAGVEENGMHLNQDTVSGVVRRRVIFKRKKEESGPRGREQCAGEPVLRRWSSPRFIRHSGLADTAHKTDCRVEPLFNECRFNQR